MKEPWFQELFFIVTVNIIQIIFVPLQTIGISEFEEQFCIFTILIQRLYQN